jgi:hypothetical protein
LQVRGIRALSDLSADDDTSIIPSRWHSAIIDMAAFYAYSSIDDTRADAFFRLADGKIRTMAETFGPDLGRMRVTRSLNSGVFEGPAAILPPQYGVMQS